MRTGTAYLPLHPGRCPPWLFKRMRKLSGAIIEALILEKGLDEVLRRFSDPFWFQAFGNVLGFDWHSSGLTTTVCGALKEALNKQNLGIKMAGGKGKISRKAPQEIEQFADELGITTKKAERLKYSSKMAAKVDNSAVQDGYQLYHHIFVLNEKGKWAVIQQGMSDFSGYARRYHWISSKIKSFVSEPHSAICGDRREERVLDMTSKQSREARKISVDLIKDNPNHLRKYFLPGKQSTLALWTEPNFKFLVMPKRVNWNLMKALYDYQPKNYEDMIAFKGVGPKTIRALALISELIYGAEPSWHDPVKYSFAHGGKDGVPYPVNKVRYDASIASLKEAIQQAKLGDEEKIRALKQLNTTGLSFRKL